MAGSESHKLQLLQQGKGYGTARFVAKVFALCFPTCFGIPCI